MKRPSFQFYPSDWLRDTGLRTCSVGARGLWMDMICFMHEGNPYGTLKVGNKVILPPNLAVMVGATLLDVEGWLEELESAGVFDRGAEGEIVSRRMIRDEYLRNIRAEGGKKGGNPALKVNPEVGSKINPEVKQKPTPSSSSPSSVSSSSSQFANQENILSLLDVPESPNPKKPKPNATPEMMRIARILNPNRRESTIWQDNEIKAFKMIDFDESEIAIVTDFYRAEERHNEPLHRRTGLLSFLNHWPDEVGKAQAWAKKYGRPVNRPFNPTGK